jgi:hypothetical protein
MKVDGHGLPDECLHFESINGETIRYEGEESHLGDCNSFSFELPTSYLFEDWRPELLAACDRAIAARAQDVAAVRERHQAAEKAKLAELQEKYPNG